MLHQDQGRADRAAALMVTHNTWEISGLRPVRGKWRQLLGLTFQYEDLRNEENAVLLSPEDPDRPVVHFRRRSPYTLEGLHSLPRELGRLLAPLPVEGFHVFPEPKPTEAHILGTTVMGNDPTTSVLDRHLIWHTVRNLVVLGSGAFPTAPPANPTLTLSALSLWSAAAISPVSHDPSAVRPPSRAQVSPADGERGRCGLRHSPGFFAWVSRRSHGATAKVEHLYRRPLSAIYADQPLAQAISSHFDYLASGTRSRGAICTRL